jgi:hypothetical protein
MKAYKSLVKFALTNNCTVSVWDGEEFQVSRSRKPSKIISAIESVEVAVLKIRDSEGKQVACAVVSAFGLADDETVTDWSVTPFMDQWEAWYFTFSV